MKFRRCLTAVSCLTTLIATSIVPYLFVYIYTADFRYRSKGVIETSSNIEEKFCPPDRTDEDCYQVPRQCSWQYNRSAVAATFEARRVRLEAACRRRFGSLSSQASAQRAKFGIQRNKVIQSTFLVDEVNKLLFCVIAKAGSSNWKQLLLYYSDNSPFVRPEQAADIVHSYSKWPKNVTLVPLSSVKRVDKRLPEFMKYTKIVWVRHPLVRLVSAWNSKFRSNNSYYEKVYGRAIIKKYRKKASNTSDTELVSLDEFFSYLLKDINAYRMSDVHWSTFNTQCMPCSVQYDYIAKLEHWYPEAHYILSELLQKRLNRTSPSGSLEAQLAKQAAEKFNSPEMQRALCSQPTSNDAKWFEWLKRLPPSLLSAVRNLYSFDFDLFGYKY